jgi:hypothetical protein|tara:strand:- start:62 stop:196 length:135 start_codon:yes stop_codon:yes gene_type:complete
MKLDYRPEIDGLFDDNHPSLKGSEMINDLIINKIDKIELDSYKD